MRKIIGLMEEYEKRFKDRFPSFQFRQLGDDGLAEVIEECLRNGKTPYELGYLTLGTDVIY